MRSLQKKTDRKPNAKKGVGAERVDEYVCLWNNLLSFYKFSLVPK